MVRSVAGTNGKNYQLKTPRLPVPFGGRLKAMKGEDWDRFPYCSPRLVGTNRYNAFGRKAMEYIFLLPLP